MQSPVAKEATNMVVVRRITRRLITSKTRMLPTIAATDMIIELYKNDEDMKSDKAILSSVNCCGSMDPVWLNASVDAIVIFPKLKEHHCFC